MSSVINLAHERNILVIGYQLLLWNRVSEGIGPDDASPGLIALVNDSIKSLDLDCNSLYDNINIRGLEKEEAKQKLMEEHWKKYKKNKVLFSSW